MEVTFIFIDSLNRKSGIKYVRMEIKYNLSFYVVWEVLATKCRWSSIEKNLIDGIELKTVIVSEFIIKFVFSVDILIPRDKI